MGCLHTLLPSDTVNPHKVNIGHYFTNCQGLCFLLPYTLWKRWEEGKLKRIIPIEDLKHQHKSKHLSPDAVKTWYIFQNLMLKKVDHKSPSLSIRFTTSYKLIDQKKINVAVGRMKDYFITRNGFQAPSRYMMKVFNHINSHQDLFKRNYLVYNL